MFNTYYICSFKKPTIINYLLSILNNHFMRKNDFQRKRSMFSGNDGIKGLIHSFLLLLFLGLSAFVSAQTLEISGQITDQYGETVPSVNVTIKGSPSIGTISDVDGNYSLSSVPSDAVVVYSFIGYRDHEESVNGRNVINITLQEESLGLDEIIVVGYGTMKKSDLTGAVTSVRIDDTDASMATSVDKLLQGRAAGVHVSTGNASPGGAISVRIRGSASLTGSNEPLYVIDGVIVDSSMDDVDNIMKGGRQASNSAQEVQNSLTSLSPQDIESIEVLKDASATAIYGSRGTNGVVIITTRKGASEKARINFNATTDIAKVAKKMPMLPGREYMNYINDRNFALGSDSRFDEDDVSEYFDWQNELTQTAVTQTYRLSASARSDRYDYYIAGGYMKNDGVVKTTGLEQLDLRFNAGYQVTDRLRASTTINSIRRENSMTTGTDNIGGVNTSMIRQMILQPTAKRVDEETDETISYSPRAWITDYEDESLETRNTISLGLDYDISKVFKARLFGGYDNRYKQRARWYGPETYTGATTNGQVGLANLRRESINLEALIFFDKTFDSDHRLSGTLGVTYDKSLSERWQMVNEDFFTFVLGINGMGYGETVYPPSTSYSNQSLFSVINRINYAYADKYLLTFTSRLDGSSKFDPKNRYSYFPAFAGAWRADQENFLNEEDWLSNLKLRAGWGKTGNQAISPFQTQNVYRNVLYTTHEGGTMVGMVPGLIANTDLVWESTKQTNIGIDFGVFNNRLSFTAEWYHKKTTDLLQKMEAPLSAGFSTITVNRGSILNEGFEFSLEATPIQKSKFSWNIGGNISFNKNKIVELGLTPGTFGGEEMIAFLGNNIASSADVQYPVNIFIEGEPVGLFWGYKTDGIWQSDEEASKFSYAGVDMQAGDVRFIDKNGDNVIDASDMTIIGDPNPDFTYGLTTNIDYSRFSLNLYFYGSYGNDIFNANLLQQENTYTSTNVRRDAYYDAWSEDNKGNVYPRLGFRLREASDRQVEDGSFLRLGSATLGYRVPIKPGAFISNLNLSVTGRNLFTISGYKGYSPDVNSFATDPMRIGIDWGGYPFIRSIAFGINMTF